MNDSELPEASLQTSRLRPESIATHAARGPDPDFETLAHRLKKLLGKMDDPPSPIHLREISSEASEATEAYAQCMEEPDIFVTKTPY